MLNRIYNAYVKAMANYKKNGWGENHEKHMKQKSSKSGATLFSSGPVPEMTDVTHRLSVARNQLPLFKFNLHRYTRSYSPIVMTQGNIKSVLAVFSDAGLNLADIACESADYSLARSLRELKELVPSGSARAQEALKIILTEAQYDTLQQYYSPQKQETPQR